MLLPLLALIGCRDAPEAPDSPDPCEGYVPTWAGWTQGFFRTWCNACHSSAAVERNGAPVGVDFDAEAGALRWRDRVRARVLDEATMPIGGGLYPEDLALLEAWLDCADDGGDETGDAGSPLPDPQWSDDEARAALTAALQVPLGDPLGARDAYLGLFDHRDADCPASEDYNLPVTRVGCTTRSGWTFAGPSTYTVEESEDLLNFLLWNDCEVLGPDGDRWLGAGTIALYREPIDGGEAWSLKQGGTWSWSGDAGWLGLGTSSALGAYGARLGEDIVVFIDGVSTGGGFSLDLREVQVDSVNCPRGTGEIALRDPNGGWFTVALGPDCSGCGELRYGDRSLGQQCPNLAAALRALSDAVLR